MAISQETEAEILRLFHAEGWPRGTIARHVGVHHSVVSRVLSRNGVVPVPTRGRRSNAEPYIAFIKQTLEKFPKLNATRLHRMVKERGYVGGIDHFRDVVRALRPVTRGEAYLRLSTLPGEQAQV